MTTDESDNGWDSLAEEFGLSADKSEPAPKIEKAPAGPARSAPKPERDPRPEIEGEADDFGSGLTADPPKRHAVLYDPGPDALAEDADDYPDAVPESLDESDEGEESPTSGEGSTEGGKKRRRRRRRKKKSGPGAPPPDVEDLAAESDSEGQSEVDEAGNDNGVEEGEAPAEVENDEDDEFVPSAMDEEMDAEAAQPRPQWHVMTWNELVSKLHRPS